jgi:pilus assembly protein FimV
MATLLQNNPHAFINDNMNRLKAGVVLNTTDTVLSTKNINRGLASSKPGDGNVAGASSRAFSQYKQAATQSVRPLLDKNGNAKTIKNSVKADIASKSSPTKDQLKVSGSANIGNQSVQATSKLNEAQIANDRAIAEEKSRISELEKNIKKSVEIKNSVLTTPQAIAQAAKPESGKLGAPSTVSPNVAAAGVAVATTAVATATSSVTPKPTESAVTAPVSASVTPSAVSAPTSISTAPTAVSTTPPAVSPATSPAPNITKPTQPAVEEPSWYENIDPMTLGGLGGVLALLGGWAVYRRKKNSESIAFSDSTFNPKDTQGGLLTAQGGQAIDTFNSVFASNFSEASMPLESAEVDPIAEADVYMQYGRDAHAEDILIDALKQNPQRHPVRLKLMELYASKGNQSGLTTQFDALSAITQATGPEWQAGKKLVEAGKVGQSNASAKVEKNATSAQSAADGDNSGFATLPMNTAIGNKPFKNTNLAIDNINLSSPTMIGDVAGNTLSSNSSLSNAAATSFNLPAAEPNALSQSPTGLSFDVQSPTILGRSNASAGLGMPAKQSIKTEPDSLLEFKVSKIDVKPEPKLPQISQLSQSSNVDLQPSSIFDKLASNSSVSATPALETKLSLAKAYTDIGDKEGARELLQEVIESGHQTLSSQAKTLLSKL